METVETEDGPYVAFTGLTPTAQRLFSNRAILPVIEARAETVAAEASLYVLINSGGTPQSEADLDRAVALSEEM